MGHIFVQTQMSKQTYGAYAKEAVESVKPVPN